ncbi:hypothetical protein TB2_010497 [Malus domestica]|uniref:Uncharacterized protein n=1 Tax=Malus domestica TaxID=3750 RepID=A0A498IMU7_MALDO|nr:hypothetical protein DVH24_036894 [Malus domestica]
MGRGILTEDEAHDMPHGKKGKSIRPEGKKGISIWRGEKKRRIRRTEERGHDREGEKRRKHKKKKKSGNRLQPMPELALEKVDKMKALSKRRE